MSPNNPTEKLALTLRTGIDWNAYFTLVSTIDDSLNSPKNRFLKSDLLEMAIEFYGPPELKWVDEQGWDHELDEEDGSTIKIEMKHHTNSLVTKQKKEIKKNVGQVRMTNTLGGGEARKLSNTFSFLLITDVAAAALVPWSVAAEACKATKDAVVIAPGRLPTSKVFFVKRPDEIQIQEVRLPSPMEIVRPHLKKYIQDVKENMT
ncbi:hypothetical protein OAR43_09395 [Gammaproteobacteria bacterium]|nr:hypothetical protein [Gammaproteobacteria bacterium]